MSVRAFAAIEKSAFYRFLATSPEGRFEYEGGRIVQLMPGTKRHFRIAQNFQRAIQAHVAEAAWDVFTGYGVDTGKTVRIADVAMVPRDDPESALATERAALIVEVLSPSSSVRDLDVKPPEYLALSSLEAYIVASQDESGCLVWVRNAARQFPGAGQEIVGAGAFIDVPALGIRIALADAYRGVDFAAG